MARLDRLIQLYSQLGLSTDAGTFNLAEIKGYCAGMDMLNDFLGTHIDEKYISKPVDFSLNNWVDELLKVAEDMIIENEEYTFVSPMVDVVGQYVIDWLLPYWCVYLGGSGVPWNDYNDSWIDLDNRLLRWSMIETMGGI